MHALTLLAFLSAAALSALILVVLCRQEETLHRGEGLEEQEEAWFTSSSGAGVAAVVMTALTHATMAAVLAMLCLTLWHISAPWLDLPPLPPNAAQFARVLESADFPRKVLLYPSAFAQTPLLHLVAIGWLGLAFVWTAWRCTERQLYDIFISYKSEDAPFARRIADALLAMGWRVWFAEYQIVLSWRPWFKTMFMGGIFHSRFALAITNDRWAKSAHCATEARTMLVRFEPGEIIELRAPQEPLPHKLFPKLARCPSLETRDVNAIVRFLEKETRNPFPGEPLPEIGGGHVFAGAFGGRPCTIDPAGWTIAGVRDNTLTSVHWEYTSLPNCALWGQLTITPTDAGKLEKNKRYGLDERYMFDIWAHWLRKGRKQLPRNLLIEAQRKGEVREAKREWRRAKPRGMHLLFYDGRPQFGLTHWIGVRNVWRRVVALDVQNPVTKDCANFLFVFTFHGTFRKYCRHTHLMDALALSLRWT